MRITWNQESTGHWSSELPTAGARPQWRHPGLLHPVGLAHPHISWRTHSPLADVLPSLPDLPCSPFSAGVHHSTTPLDVLHRDVSVMWFLLRFLALILSTESVMVKRPEPILSDSCPFLSEVSNKVHVFIRAWPQVMLSLHPSESTGSAGLHWKVQSLKSRVQWGGGRRGQKT